MLTEIFLIIIWGANTTTISCNIFLYTVCASLQRRWLCYSPFLKWSPLIICIIHIPRLQTRCSTLGITFNHFSLERCLRTHYNTDLAICKMCSGVQNVFLMTWRYFVVNIAKMSLKDQQWRREQVAWSSSIQNIMNLLQILSLFSSARRVYLSPEDKTSSQFPIFSIYRVSFLQVDCPRCCRVLDGIYN